MSLAWRGVHPCVPHPPDASLRVVSRPPPRVRCVPIGVRRVGSNISPPVRGTRVFLSDPDCSVGEDSEGLPVLVCPSAPDEDPSLGPSHRYLEFDFSEEEEESRGDAADPRSALWARTKDDANRRLRMGACILREGVYSHEPRSKQRFSTLAWNATTTSLLVTLNPKPRHHRNSTPYSTPPHNRRAPSPIAPSPVGVVEPMPRERPVDEFVPRRVARPRRARHRHLHPFLPASRGWPTHRTHRPPSLDARSSTDARVTAPNRQAPGRARAGTGTDTDVPPASVRARGLPPREIPRGRGRRTSLPRTRPGETTAARNAPAPGVPRTPRRRGETRRPERNRKTGPRRRYAPSRERRSSRPSPTHKARPGTFRDHPDAPAAAGPVPGTRR